jgi:hypothetical protein
MPKDYRKNIDYYRDYNADYYLRNKVAILHNQATPVLCKVCQKVVCKINFPRHTRSAIHHKNAGLSLHSQSRAFGEDKRAQQNLKKSP